MAQVIIRNLDDEVVKVLKVKAELYGRPLEQELRKILTEAAQLTPHERLQLADRIRGMTPQRFSSDSTDLIREDRDNR